MKFFHPKRMIRKNKTAIHDFYWHYAVPDSWSIKHIFKKKLGYKCNLKEPRSFNEKIQWLKLHDRKDIYRRLVDKQEVKKIIGDLIGNEYIIPTLGVWNRFEDINFEALPNQFVLKCTHDSASVVVCKDKSTFNYSFAKQKLSDALKTDYYHYIGKQWAYKGIKRRIIAEEFLSDGAHDDLIDYKFMVFNGKSKCVFVCSGRGKKGGMTLDAFDMDWQLLPFTRNNHPNSTGCMTKPMNYETMLALAEKIARFVDNPFVRVDFYDVDGRVYFGEVTFYPEGGLGKFKPVEWDYIMGGWMDLSHMNGAPSYASSIKQ